MSVLQTYGWFGTVQFEAHIIVLDIRLLVLFLNLFVTVCLVIELWSQATNLPFFDLRLLFSVLQV